jgi:hypothetical protein
MTGEALSLTAAVLAEAQADPEVRADVMWLADTMRRAHLRLGRALAALGELPALLAAASQLQMPDGAYDDAEAITSVIRRAVEELEAIEDYAWAVTDPGEAACRACGAQLGIFAGLDGWRHWHWRPVADLAALSGQRREVFEAGHEPDPVFARPERPDWSARESERALNVPADGSGGENNRDRGRADQ